MTSLKIKTFKLAFTLIFISILFSCTDNNVINLDLLLSDMTDRETIAEFPDPAYKLKQFSSYDRRSVGPIKEGWFANADYTQFIRVENTKGRREFVLFDHDGPGAIVRWWMTFAGEGSHNGTLRVYIDRSEDPLIEDNILKVISGQLLAEEPLSSSVSDETDYYRRGHNLYLPLPYSDNCKITYECDSIKITEERRRPSVYYNICYRDYDKNVKVESLTPEKLNSSKSLIAETNKKLLKGSNISNESIKAEVEILAGEKHNLVLTDGGAISKIKVKAISENLNQALRSTVLEIRFDNTRTVFVPVGDFFGTGFELHPSNTWFSVVDAEGWMESTWLMPFKDIAEISFHNFDSIPVTINYEVFRKDYKWKNNTMYFAASWHEYHQIKTAGAESVGGTGKHSDINYVDIEGKGVYAGDAVTVFNTVDAWWGEGDEKIFVDNEAFPSSIGTGTEDYYGYAWCRPEKFSHPFIAQPTGAGNFHPGMTVNMRYRVLDAIPFEEKISANIELWHWASTIMNYALTSYYYVFPEYKINIEVEDDIFRKDVPVKKSDIIKPHIGENGVMEGEYLEVMTSGEGTAGAQFITSWDWSNKGQLWWRNAEKGDKMHTRLIIPETGKYEVIARLSKARDYGIISFEINANKAGGTFNGYTDGEEVVEVNLGDHILLEGDNIFSVIIEGRDKRAKEGNMAGIDCLTLMKL